MTLIDIGYKWFSVPGRAPERGQWIRFPHGMLIAEEGESLGELS